MTLDYQALFEQSPDLLLVLLPDPPRFSIVAATRAYLSGTHTTYETTVGRGLFDVFPDNPNDPDATGTTNLRASLERVLASRAPDRMAIQKYDIRGHDGTFMPKYWSPRNLPVLSAQGGVEYILHSVEDVTDIVQATELGEMLRGRTAAMEREALNRTNELEAFSYSISHDLRAPLRAIHGFSRALAEDYREALSGGDGQRYVDRICAGVDRMGQLIDDLLGLSQITRATIHRHPVDLSSLAESVVAGLQRADPGRVVGVTIGQGLRAEGDTTLLRVLLENLIGNAWKFTAFRQNPAIEFGRLLTPPEEDPTFFVRDNGAGFDLSHARRLFSPFQRLHSAQDFAGTGIGLASVQRVVARHGGRVWAEAEVDRGATFFFTLPVAVSPAAA